MSTLPSSWLAVIALAATLAAPTVAHAGSGRIVVMPFEGPVALADDTRAAIVNQVSRSYDVVAPTSWVKARRAAEEQELGAKVWARAAKKAKVDAVVEGKVVRRGRSAALELTVIDAHGPMGSTNAAPTACVGSSTTCSGGSTAWRRRAASAMRI